MRGISVRNPWPGAIIHGGADVLNWNEAPSDRWLGEVAIHVSRGVTSSATFRYVAERVTQHERILQPLGVGMVIGTVQLVDVHPQTDGCCTSPWADQSWTGKDGQPGRQVTHLVLEQPRAFRTPVPASGSLGLWKPHRLLRSNIDAARRECAVR